MARSCGEEDEEGKRGCRDNWCGNQSLGEMDTGSGNDPNLADKPGVDVAVAAETLDRG